MVDFCGSGLVAEKREKKIPWLGTTVPLLFMRNTYSMLPGEFNFFLMLDYLISTARNIELLLVYVNDYEWAMVMAKNSSNSHRKVITNWFCDWNLLELIGSLCASDLWLLLDQPFYVVLFSVNQATDFDSSMIVFHS